MKTGQVHLVDDIAKPLGTSLGRKGEGAALAPGTDDVGDIVVKSIHSLAGQREADVVVLQPVLDLHGPPHEPHAHIISLFHTF